MVVRREPGVENGDAPMSRRAPQGRERTSLVTDVILLAVIFAFFALAVVFVRACEHIIGPDLESQTTAVDATDTDRAA
jgi:hypothetical protein